MNRAAAVFLGEVVTWDSLVAVVKVDKVWKGKIDKTVRMQLGTRMPNGGFQYDTCDYDFSGDKNHLVFAEEATDGAMVARKCHLTAPMPLSAATVRILDDLVKSRRPQ